MACSVPEEPNYPPPPRPVAGEGVVAGAPAEGKKEVTEENARGTISDVTEIISTAANAIITRTTPSLISTPPTPAGEYPAATNSLLNSGSHPSTIPSAVSTSTPLSKPTTAAPCSIEPPVQLRSSRSFKRDSGLAVEESPTAGNPTIAFATPAPTQGYATSPMSGKLKRYASSVVGAASIGGGSVAPSILTPEDELASRRVRSLYDSGSDIQSSYSRRGPVDSDAGSMVVPGGRTKRLSRGLRNSLVVTDEEGGFSPEIGSGALREEEEGEQVDGRTELTIEARNTSVELPGEKEEILPLGGMEGWSDIEGKQIDRYGFIVPDGTAAGNRQENASIYKQSTTSRRNRRLKVLVNAFDNEKSNEMLQSPAVRQKDETREKEIQRAKKWKAMATSMTNGTKNSRWKRAKSSEKLAEGAGMNWKFSTKDPKLISRTWKGIPDCWRGAAWHSFLTSSAEKRGNCLPDEELKAIYHELVERGSADDVQIDLDVPRTISSHIMFRHRYRGGQRLLFRVLHALSLHFPEVGYVQGMAALGATLLCYYDEETTFIMLVRLWELRGLGKLYEPGFGGLMEALDELENKWLKGGLVSQQLEVLGIEPTAYGTKWYLTLFNYSIPFPAQLRVWDVFMLLGDPETPAPASSSFCRQGGTFAGLHFGHHKSGSEHTIPHNPQQTQVGFGGTLDIIHATSAALIDGMKDMLLTSDFENAMKMLTSWIPVKDEELLMKVAKTEWKVKRRRRPFGGRESTGGASGNITWPRETAPTSPTVSQRGRH
ncbi:rab-GTPase-TBC domain-containing protein [Tirmania nivea]|nr:rab-GTPase-TBC domain-containing protein [Tirmania nivea]